MYIWSGDLFLFTQALYQSVQYHITQETESSSAVMLLEEFVWILVSLLQAILTGNSELFQYSKAYYKLWNKSLYIIVGASLCNNITWSNLLTFVNFHY